LSLKDFAGIALPPAGRSTEGGGMASGSVSYRVYEGAFADEDGSKPPHSVGRPGSFAGDRVPPDRSPGGAPGCSCLCHDGWLPSTPA
jgi:hypothetical protein